MTTHFAHSVPRLKRLLPRLRGKRIGVLGDLMLDRYLWGTASRLSPEAAVPVVDLVGQNECLGGGGNVAANLAALGAKVEAFGVIGSDEAGRALQKCLREASMGDRGVLAEAKRVTTVKRSEEHTSELQSRLQLVCRLLLEKKKILGLRVRHPLRRAPHQLHMV